MLNINAHGLSDLGVLYWWMTSQRTLKQSEWSLNSNDNWTVWMEIKWNINGDDDDYDGDDDVVDDSDDIQMIVVIWCSMTLYLNQQLFISYIMYL